jgi:hypothetical protein
MELEKLIEELRGKGLEDEEIIKSLEQMVQEGKLSPEELDHAKNLLEENERKDAERLFGLEFVK